MAEAGPLDEFASRPGGPAARADRVRLGPGQRRPAAAAQGGQAAGAARLRTWRARPTWTRGAQRCWPGIWRAGDLRRRSPAPPGPCPRRRIRVRLDLLLDGLALLITDGPAAAAPTLRQAVNALRQRRHLRRRQASGGAGWPRSPAAVVLWDADGWHAIAARQIQLARNAGALDQLPIYLAADGHDRRLDAATSRAAAAADRGGRSGLRRRPESRIPPFTALLLAGLRGSEAEAVPLIEATIDAAAAAGQGIMRRPGAHWVAAVLYNGLGRYDEAAAAAAAGRRRPPGIYVSVWALPELVEAAVRSGKRPSSPAMRWSGWRRRPRPAAPTGAWASRRAHARC